MILSVDGPAVTADRCVATRRDGRGDTTVDVLDLVRAGADGGAGGILLNEMDVDGTREGFDVAYTRRGADAVPVRVIASGGARKAVDFRAVLFAGRAGAALGAEIFHDGPCRVSDVKRYLRAHGVEVRPC